MTPHSDRSTPRARQAGATDPVRGFKHIWRLGADASVAASDPNSLVRAVLSARNIRSDDPFLTPSLGQLHDPSLMPGIDKSAARLLEALESKQRVCIYGDYDVDGITATAILYHTLLAIDPAAAGRVMTYVPHRLEEGYGLNSDAIRSIANDGASVIVSVDCGVTAHEPARVAREIGVDLIITDHHNPDDQASDQAGDHSGDEADNWPDAFAVVHPRAPGSAYPFEHLSGAGVAFKLAWRLCTMFAGADKASAAHRKVLLDLLAFAALGTIADIVPLVGENRVLAAFGLGRIKHSTVPGLAALVRASGLHGESIDAEAVGFRLAPRLNACGRMGHAAAAVELFTTATGSRADEIARQLDAQNDARRATEQRITAEARQMLESVAGFEDSRSIVVASEGWHPGVAGIVASRLVDRFARPTIVLCTESGTCKGSGRSIPAFNLHAGLQACRDSLSTFGGHDAAAGLSLSEDRLNEFRDRFEAVAREHLTPDQLATEVDVDATASLAALTPDTIRSLDTLKPFGASNPRVKLRLSDLVLEGRRVFGKAGDHLKLRVRDAKRGQWADVVAWGWAEHFDRVREGTAIEAVVTPEISSYSGRIEPVLTDLRTL